MIGTMQDRKKSDTTLRKSNIPSMESPSYSEPAHSQATIIPASAVLLIQRGGDEKCYMTARNSTIGIGKSSKLQLLPEWMLEHKAGQA